MKRRDVYTTGQVAEICNVAPRTVTKWFDTGKLKGYRIPGSRDRRIPLSDLLRFMNNHNMPTERLDLGVLRVMVIDSDLETCNLISKKLESYEKYQLQAAANSFEAGLYAQKFKPHVILINMMSDGIDAMQICRSVHTFDDIQGAKVIALAQMLGDFEADNLLSKGFDGCVKDPGDLKSLIDAIEHASLILS